MNFVQQRLVGRSSGSSSFVYNLAVVAVAGSMLLARQSFFAGEQTHSTKSSTEGAAAWVRGPASEVTNAMPSEDGVVRQGREPTSRYGRAGDGERAVGTSLADGISAPAAVSTETVPLMVEPLSPTGAASPPSAPVRGRVAEDPMGPSANSLPEAAHYRVSKGDTITAIAARHGVSKETIVAVNKLQMNPDRLTIGQDLIIPLPKAQSKAVAQLALTMATDAGEMTPQPAGGDASTNNKDSKPLTVAQVSLAIDPDVKHWELIQSMIEPAQTSQRDTGVPASATIAQAIHESAWGASALSREGYNFFGIKASAKDGTKGSIKMNTSENVRGSNIMVRDAFRAYNSMTESFEDHGRFFVENSRYARAMARVNDPRAFVRLISEAGYATDPKYASKVIAYMDKYNLYQYDLLEAQD